MGLYKPTRDKNRPRANWYGSYRDPESGKWLQICLRTADKQAARIRLTGLERKASLKMAGLDNPFDEHERRPLDEHLSEWRRALAAKGDTAQHVRESHRQAERVLIDVCKCKTTRDIVASDVATCIADLVVVVRKGKGRKRTLSGRSISARSRNGYLGACKSFCTWLVRDRRAPMNRLAHLSRVNERTDRRLVRRAMVDDELRTLLTVTKSGPVRYGVAGESRYWLYRIASETGLRSGELRALTWADVDLDGKTPAVTVRAASSKNRHEDTVPLRVATAAMLAAWRDERGCLDSAALVFDMPHACNVVRMFRDDLEAAGIDPGNADNVLDFHALRHTFITNLARGGVHPKLAQDLARHSTIELTMRAYTHTLLPDRAAALDVLPDVEPATITVAKAG